MVADIERSTLWKSSESADAFRAAEYTLFQTELTPTTATTSRLSSRCSPGGQRIAPTRRGRQPTLVPPSARPDGAELERAADLDTKLT